MLARFEGEELCRSCCGARIGVFFCFGVRGAPRPSPPCAMREDRGGGSAVLCSVKQMALLLLSTFSLGIARFVVGVGVVVVLCSPPVYCLLPQQYTSVPVVRCCALQLPWYVAVLCVMLSPPVMP